MNPRDTVLTFADSAAEKAALIRRDPLGFIVLAMKAGAYVGLGILLIFSVGQGVEAGLRPIVMGASFGIALTLVIFAGSELFTGHTMYMTLGWLSGRTGLADLARAWGLSWSGNLLGALLLAAIFVLGGGGLVLHGGETSLLLEVAQKKAASAPLELIARAILCNWLVCLAIWCAARSSNDVAKCVLIFWCLYAFIAAGFEHSVANMTVFSVALLSGAPGSVTIGAAATNLLFVTFGNAVAGAVLMGFGYWIAAARPVAPRPRDAAAP